MSPQAFKKTLIERGEHYALEAVLLASKPILFPGRPDYEQWQDQVARAARLVNAKVFLIGSAVMGFSLAPFKYGRAFSPVASRDRPASDLDLVIVDTNLFHECWAATLHEDRLSKLNFFGDDKVKLMQDVYYGFTSDKTTPRSAKVFQKMIAMRSICGRHPASSGIRLNMRIYHRHDDFVGYQISSLRTLKRSFNLQDQ